MSRVFIIRKRQVQLFIVLVALIILAGVYLNWDQSRAVSGQAVEPRIIQLVTGEFKTTLDGKEIEAYVWSPGTIFINKGETVELHINGVNGSSHPFVVEELGIRGDVIKGKTTVVRFTANKEGIFPIICLTHTELHNGGPMVGYIVVD